MNPKYPVYVISKGRWDSRKTVRALDGLRVPFTVVVEPQEAHEYARVIGAERLLVMPFSNLGQGSIPVRNFVWEHARMSGAARHWILDDNIEGFYRLNRNMKIPVTSGTIFRAAEDFVDRYENVALAGFNYFMFCKRKDELPAFVANTRIYSCLLIRNDLPYRWRGRYNEDTDLSLRAMKDGWCTIQFNAFLQAKTTTMTMKGGNTDELYKGDGRKAMAESLVAQHPDVASVSWRFGRWQHHADYSPFRRNKLIRKSGVEVPEGVNNYGMVLRSFDGEHYGEEVKLA